MHVHILTRVIESFVHITHICFQHKNKLLTHCKMYMGDVPVNI